MNDELAQIGKRIRQRRRLLDIPQRALAEAVGVTFQQISKYETGQNEPSVLVFARIAQVLEVPMEDLLPAAAADLAPIKALADKPAGRAARRAAPDLKRPRPRASTRVGPPPGSRI